MRHLLAAAAVAVIAVAGCGGGNDEDEAKKTVEQFFTALDKRDADKLCGEVLTREFIEQSTAATGDRADRECRRQFSSLQAPNVKLREVQKVTVDGDDATVRALIERSGQPQPQVLRLQKQGGDWRLAGAGGQ